MLPVSHVHAVNSALTRSPRTRTHESRRQRIVSPSGLDQRVVQPDLAESLTITAGTAISGASGALSAMCLAGSRYPVSTVRGIGSHGLRHFILPGSSSHARTSRRVNQAPLSMRPGYAISFDRIRTEA